MSDRIKELEQERDALRDALRGSTQSESKWRRRFNEAGATMQGLHEAVSQQASRINQLQEDKVRMTDKITELHGLIGKRNGTIKALELELQKAVETARAEAEKRETLAKALDAAGRDLRKANRAEDKAVKAAREARARAEGMARALRDARDALASMATLRGKIDGLLMKDGGE